MFAIAIKQGDQPPCSIVGDEPPSDNLINDWVLFFVCLEVARLVNKERLLAVEKMVSSTLQQKYAEPSIREITAFTVLCSGPHRLYPDVNQTILNIGRPFSRMATSLAILEKGRAFSRMTAELAILENDRPFSRMPDSRH